MNRRLKSEGIVKDDKGVALTEFVIVIPIVLLFFFAILQFFEIVQAAELGNYAAYVAARSYSVRAQAATQPDSYSPQDAAKYAASMALAPVAQLVSGGSSSGGLNLSALSSLASGDITKLGYGSGVAYGLLSIGGFSASTTSIGSHQQAVVAINYPQQINVPGFASLWNLVSGSDINSSLQPLGNIKTLGMSILSGTPYINVPSQCSTGCEKWSGVAQQANSSPAKWQ
jgi:Flp pilus assembly protein TadG